MNIIIIIIIDLCLFNVYRSFKRIHNSLYYLFHSDCLACGTNVEGNINRHAYRSQTKLNS